MNNVIGKDGRILNSTNADALQKAKVALELAHQHVCSVLDAHSASMDSRNGKPKPDQDHHPQLKTGERSLFNFLNPTS